MRQERSWFGFGGIKKSALKDIARKEEEINSIVSDITDIREEMDKQVYTRETQFKEFESEKKKLRELLDLTTDDFKERQEDLVDAALTFVNTMDERSGTVLSHMEKIRDQIGNVDDVNGRMQKIFAVINEGVKDAEEANQGITEMLKDRRRRRKSSRPDRTGR